MQLIGFLCLNAFRFAAASRRLLTHRAGVRPRRLLGHLGSDGGERGGTGASRNEARGALPR